MDYMNDIIIVQSNGQIENPHYHSGGWGWHTDAWVVKYEYGDYYIAKIHDDDDITKSNPRFEKVPDSWLR